MKIATRTLARIPLLIAGFCFVFHPSSARAEDCVPHKAEAFRPISFDQLVDKAEKTTELGEGNITSTATGALLKAMFQDLEAEATPDGLWLKSSCDESRSTDLFRIRAVDLGRADGSRVSLQKSGEVDAESELVTFRRPRLNEEYSVGMNGVRQDFILLEKPAGQGELRVGLEVCGARAEAAGYGSLLVLDHSGRRIAYNRLHVTDATGRTLGAHMDVGSPRGIVIRIDDEGAEYPVRIDPTFSDEDWVSLGGICGADDWVKSVYVDSLGNLYVGGEFTILGDIVANHIAKWDGNSWSALGSGMDGSWSFVSVNAITEWNGDLYVGGTFSSAGGVSANHIARWDGTSWSALGTGLSGSVAALTVFNNELYVGGYFGSAGGTTALRIAKWSGSSWSALGTGVSGGEYQTGIYDMVVYNGFLYAGGDFATAGGVSAENIARWNGVSWSSVDVGVQSTNNTTSQDFVDALAVYGGNLYVAGTFNRAGSGFTNYPGFARWNGSSWSSVVTAIGNIETMTVSGGYLYLAGSLYQVTVTPGNTLDVGYVTRWNGSTWSAVGPPGYGAWDGRVDVIAVLGGEVFAGGRFTSIEGDAIKYLARWDGSEWGPMSGGLNGNVRDIEVAGSNLFIGGDFTKAGNVTVNRVVMWDGSAWSPLAEGMDGSVHVLESDGGNLYAGGAFLSAGGLSAPRIAKWDGSSWSALGSGMNNTVNTLLAAGGDLYAGGSFVGAGGVIASRIAKWDGVGWSPLGSGADSTVMTLAEFGGEIYAGGNFTTAGGVAANRVAKWDGSAWSGLGSGLNGGVFALTSAGANLYAGGGFSTAGSVGANRIAKWDGSEWSALGSGVNSNVWTLQTSGGDVFAGGDFTTAGGITVNRIARWGGSAWSSLGTGANATVRCLATTGTDLFTGGDFTLVGDTVSAHVAQAEFAPGVVFPDSNLEAAVRAGLGIPVGPISIEWMETLTSLNLSDQGITVLTGLETAVNLTNLRLHGNPLADATDSWAILDQLPLDFLTVDVPRPGGDPADQHTIELVDYHDHIFYMVADTSSPGELDILTDLSFSYQHQVNIAALREFVDLGFTLYTSLQNISPLALASYEITNGLTAEIRLDASGSTDLDGSVSNYAWTWSGGSTTGLGSSVVVPEGVSTITLTVTDDDGATGSVNLDVTAAREGFWMQTGRQDSPVPAPIHFTRKIEGITAGAYHAIVLWSDGSVDGVGANNLGQISVPEAAQSEVTAISSGIGHNLARKEDGSVVAWGLNIDGQIAVPAAAMSGVIEVAAGGRHSLALKDDGSVISWGWLTSVPFDAQSGVKAIAAGYDHSLALKMDGSVKAWGINHSGEATVPPEAQSGVEAIAAGYHFSAVLKTDGSVFVWGETFAPDVKAVPLGAQSGVEKIATTWTHILALKNDGSVVAWGRSESGQCDVPAALSGMEGVAGGQDFSLAFTKAGSIVGWGDNYHGILVPDGALKPEADQLAVGLEHTLALLDDGSVVGWGWSGTGGVNVPTAAQSGVVEVAAGWINAMALKPNGQVIRWDRYGTLSVPLEIQYSVNAIATGRQHCVALRSGGQVYVWGASGSAHATIPAAAQSGVTAIAAGGDHTLALANGGEVVEWGDSGPVAVPSEARSGVSKIAAGFAHSVALKDGKVIVWGSDEYGQSTVPVEATRGVIAIAAGDYHTVALKQNGTAIVWGRDEFGESHVAPRIFNRVRTIAAGGNATLFKVGPQISPTVVFADANLETALRTKLGIFDGAVTELDMESLTELDLGTQGISDLSGLEKATNLRVLDLRENTFGDLAAAWAVLDGMTLHAIHYDSARPSGNPPGMLTQSLTDTGAQGFLTSVDIASLSSLDITGLDVDLSVRDNLLALRAFANAGVAIDSGGVKLPPIAVAANVVIDPDTGEVQLDGTGSGDIDGSIASYDWSWNGETTSGSFPLVVLPPGSTDVTLTVTDNDGASGQMITTVQLPVRFADSVLEEAIRTILNIPTDPIELADMQLLTSLDFYGLGITDLTGLQTATNLKVLDLRGNPLADTGAAWAILDALPLLRLYIDAPRPGGDPPGLVTRTVTDIFGTAFLISVDPAKVPALDVSGLYIDTSVLENINALQDFEAAGVTIENGGGNFQPAPVPAYAVVDGGIGQVVLDGSASADFDGMITTYIWSWTGGSSIGVNPTVTLPQGSTVVTLLVIDSGGASASATMDVELIPNIAVEDPDGNDLVSGEASFDFGGVVVGLNPVKAFTIRNAGTGNLSGIQVRLVEPAPEPFINEFHYQDNGTDQEFVEVAGPAGTDLSSWRLAFYRADGTWRTNQSFGAGAVIPDEGNGHGVFSLTINNIPNQAGAIALFDQSRGNLVVDFISYGGAGPLFATGGQADGMEAFDTGLFEDGGTAPGDSLQLEGTGSRVADFTWAGPQPASPGTINSAQSLEAPTGSGPFILNVSGLATSIGPQEIGNFTLEFAPTAETSLGVTLRITSNDPDESPFEIAITGTGEAPVPVNIPDSALMTALRSELNIPTGDIHVHELGVLTDLDLGSLGIADLTGLEFAVNLRILDIRGNAFTDGAATWAILDQLTLFRLYTDLQRPGGAPPGLLTGEVTDSGSSSFFISLDPDNQPTLEITGLDLDLNEQSNIAALKTFADAGVSIDNGGANLPPLAAASYSVIDDATGQVQLDASGSGDIDGSISSYAWSWNGETATGLAPAVALTEVITQVTLTVTDDDGAIGMKVFDVVLPVVFPDSALEAVVRNVIGITSGPIYPADMLALTELDLGWQGVGDLTGLEFSTNLRTLHLRGNLLGDTTALASLNLHLITADTPPFNVGDFPGLMAWTVMDFLQVPFLIAVDTANLASLDITGLNIDLSVRENLIALEKINDAGVGIDNGGENLPPIPRPTYNILNQSTGEVRLYGYTSSDIDGDIWQYQWTWGSRFETGSLVDVFMPPGDTEVTLTVVDYDAESNAELFVVSIPIDIPDTALEAAIAAKLGFGTGPFYESDLLSISELDLRGLGITDLSGLEYAGNLVNIDIRDNPFAYSVALWTTLDQIPLDLIVYDVPRPGGDPPGMATESFTHAGGTSFFVSINPADYPVLDLSTLDLDTAVLANLQALQTLMSEGVTMDNGGVNLSPVADASFTVIDTATRTVRFDGGMSLDVDGNIVSYTWNWEGGSSVEVAPVVSLPSGVDHVNLTVTDNEGATDVVNLQVWFPEAFTVCFDLGNLGTHTGGGERMQTVFASGAAIEPVFDVANGWTFTGWDVPFDNIAGNLIVTAQFEIDSQPLEVTLFEDDFEEAATGRDQWTGYNGWTSHGDTGANEILKFGSGTNYASLGFHAPQGGNGYSRIAQDVDYSGNSLSVQQWVRFTAPSNGVYSAFYLLFYNQDFNFIGNAFFLPDSVNVDVGIAADGRRWGLSYDTWYLLTFSIDFVSNTVDIAVGSNPPFATDLVFSNKGLPLSLSSFTYSWEFYDAATSGNAYMNIDDIRVAAVYPPSSPGEFNEVEPNNDFASAFELYEEAFTLSSDPDILDSTTVPHLSVNGSGDGSFDYYRIKLDRNNSTLVVDIDHTSSLDSYIGVWDASGALVLLDDDSATIEGAGGSTSGRDSFLSLSGLDAGTYYIGVAAYPASHSGGNSGFSAGSSPLGVGAVYELQVSTNSFTPGDPEIRIVAFDSDLTSDGPPVDLGNGSVGLPGTPVTLTIRNDGTDELSCLAVLRAGAHAGEITVDDSNIPAFLAPGEVADFTVTFTPGGSGIRSAELRISSNDADENPFVVNLQGTAVDDVIFADSNLEVAIRSQLNIPTGPITGADIEAITNLDLSNLGITDLSGLETATNLRILNILGNPFTDAAATWAILDQLTLYCLYTNLQRPDGDPPGLLTEAVTDTGGTIIYITADPTYLPTLDITGLDIDSSQQSNLDALQVFVDAGVTVEGLPENQAPTASAVFSVLDIATGQVQFDGSTSSDPDGSIASYTWSWSGGSGSGASPTVNLPPGVTLVTLTVSDNRGATDDLVFTVGIVSLSAAIGDAGLAGDDALPDAEPFGDGVPNLLKYAFNMNLGGADSSTLVPGAGTSGLPTYALDDSGPTTVVRVEYIRRKGSGLDYTPMKSGDLSTGSFVPMNGTETTETINGEFERVTVVAPCDPATEPSCFWQVRVMIP